MHATASYGFVWEAQYRGGPVLIGAMRRTQQNRRYAARFVNDYWVFDYSISPYGRYKAGARSRIWSERPPRVGHLYPPRVPYTEDLRKARQPIEDAWLIFTAGDLAGLDKLIPAGCACARFVDPQGLCQPLLERAAQIGKEEGQKGFWKAQAVFFEIIALLLSSAHVKDATYAIGKKRAQSSGATWTAAVRDFLQTRYAHAVRLDEIARKFNVSVSTLCHRYQAETGESPINAHLRMRIEHVKNLLLKGQTLKTTAEETGFCDPYHLSKTFKNIVGLSPRQFVESLTKTN
jgi:AraC-like DNA-binding protein